MSEQQTKPNPFSVNDPDLLHYYKSIQLIDRDINKLKNELKRKTDALIEVQKNHIKSYEEGIERLKSMCTHVNDDGSPATNKTYRDRLEFGGMGKYHKISQCDICGKTFISSTVEIDEQKLQNKNRELMAGEGMDIRDDDEFIANMDFDMNAPISIINKKGNVEPMFVKKRVREEIKGDDGT